MKNVLLTNDFFVAITNLFYAFSMIDKKMVIEEKKEIIWAVKEDWATNEYGFNSEELIYETMRELIKEKIPAEKAFDFFKQYMQSKKELFTDEVNVSLIETCHKIANAQNGVNKSELILLSKLQLLINDIEKK